jgi:NAD(P)-dependent dehydrogenase (short-subunit alcohol dehydrogenase family)
VLITGVCGGVGRATATRLRHEGWAVYGTDILDRPLDLPLDKFWQGNIAEEEFWGSVIRTDLAADDSLRGFVHNAAVQPCSKITETSLEEWNTALAVNLTAAFLGTRCMVPLFKGRDAAIVHVSSVHSMATSAGMSAYVSSKGGLLAFTRAAALELAELDIRVNAVLPGAVDTDMLEAGFKRSSSSPGEARAALVSRTPLRRLAAPDEIARAIGFLLEGSQSGFMTGQTLVIDGGVLARLSSE